MKRLRLLLLHLRIVLCYVLCIEEHNIKPQAA
jgi:hypothetical protein